MSDMATIHERVTWLREQKGWTQGQLLQAAARYLPPDDPISRSTLSRLEHAERTPRAPVVAALAQALGVSTDFLLGLTDDPTPFAPALPGAPAPELASLVQRLNALPTDQRRAYAAAFEQLLDLATEPGARSPG